MLRSMTGYGRSAFTMEGADYALEVKSLNHRYLDVRIKVPEQFYGLDERIRDMIKKRFRRGSFTVVLVSETPGPRAVRLNMEAARAYLEAAEKLKKELGVRGDVDLPLLMNTRDIFIPEARPADDRAWRTLKKGLEEALDAVEAWRIKEGRTLERDLRKRCRRLKTFTTRIEKRAPAIVRARSETFRRTLEILTGREVDESAILSEAAAWAEKTDVTEETVRMRSHIEAFEAYLDSDEPVGKRLDFLAQEMFREVNTIASKASDALVAHLVVEAKNEVERIREQVQNIE